MDISIAQGLARGDLHPETGLPIEDEWPDFQPIGRRSGEAPVGSSRVSSKSVRGDRTEFC